MSGTLATPTTPVTTVEIDGRSSAARPPGRVRTTAPAAEYRRQAGRHRRLEGHRPAPTASSSTPRRWPKPSSSSRPAAACRRSGPQTVKGESVWGAGAAAGRAPLLAQATVKAGVAAGHHPGLLLQPARPADERRPRRRRQCGSPRRLDPAFVFNSITRNVTALNQQPVPGTPINPASRREDGRDRRPDPRRRAHLDRRRPSRRSSPVNPGDTIVWKAADGDARRRLRHPGSGRGRAPVRVRRRRCPRSARRWSRARRSGARRRSPPERSWRRATVKAGRHTGDDPRLLLQSARPPHERLSSRRAGSVFPAYLVHPARRRQRGGRADRPVHAAAAGLRERRRPGARPGRGAHPRPLVPDPGACAGASSRTIPNSGYKNAPGDGHLRALRDALQAARRSAPITRRRASSPSPTTWSRPARASRAWPTATGPSCGPSPSRWARSPPGASLADLPRPAARATRPTSWPPSRKALADQ